jgi:DNA-binding transcriptional regulator YdaS (Cro superfamily)
MTLNEYLAELPLGGQAQFATRCNISAAYLSQISTGFRAAGIELAAIIERESGGRVSVQEIRPDVDWKVIRPPAPKPPKSTPTRAA